jgi:PAS domain S-box-containing protein
LEIPLNFGSIETLLNAVPAALFCADANGKCIFVNDAWCKITQLSKADGLDENWTKSIHPDDRIALQEARSLGLKSGTAFSHKFRIQRKTGEVRFVELSVSILSDETGARSGHIGTLQDFTNEKLVEGKLTSRKEDLELSVVERALDFSTLAETIPQLVWISDQDGSLNYVNRKWTDYTGVSLGSLENTVDLIHSEDEEKWRKIWKMCLETGRPYEVEYRLRHLKSGCYRWHLVRAEPVKNEQGVIARWFGTCTDIHDQKISQENLREIKNRTAMIMQDAPILLWAVNERGDFTYYEGKVGKKLGFTEKDRLVKNILELYEERTEISQSVRRALQGETVIGEARFDQIWLENKFIPQFSSTGEITGVIGLSVDVSERKLQEIERQKIEAALKESEKQIMKSSFEAQTALASTKMKSEFLANMSHEIRTPINGVLGMTGLLLDTALNSEQKEFASAIQSSGQVLLGLINDILDFSKIEAGKLELEIIDFDLNHLVRELEKSFSYSIKQKGLKFLKSVQPALPPRYRSDPTRIRQILTNLIANAIKFTDSGYVIIDVTAVTTEGQVTFVKFEVSDTGIGMSKEALAKLFQAFTQADSSTSRKYGGSGLGLSISKHIVKLLGGDIGVSSDEGRGSTFWFTLPLEAASSQLNDGIVTEAYFIQPAHRSPVRLRILLAEDNTINQLIGIKMLEKMGHYVDVAANGREVLDALSRAPYDLILMDCQMPEMDGYEATRKVRELNSSVRTIPIIAMTANAMDGDREKCLSAGMNDYLTKPVSQKALASIVDKLTTIGVETA